MTPKPLHIVSKWFKDFGEVIQNNNDDYAFYRASMFSNSTGNIIFYLLVSDIDGATKSRQIEVDLLNRVIYGSRIKFKNEQVVVDAVYTLVERLENLPYDCEKIYFEFCSEFKIGRIFDSTKEEGSVVLYLIGNTSDQHSFCLSSTTSLDGLTVDWARIKDENIKKDGDVKKEEVK